MACVVAKSPAQGTNRATSLWPLRYRAFVGAFNPILGCSNQDFDRFRVERPKELLTETSLSLPQLAGAVNLQDLRDTGGIELLIADRYPESAPAPRSHLRNPP
jgi:hypothetical protein